MRSSHLLYVIAAAVALIIIYSIASNLWFGARSAPTETEWRRVRGDFATLGFSLVHISEHHDPVNRRISGVFVTQQPKDVAVMAVADRLISLGWKEYEPLRSAHGKISTQVCRDGVVGSVSARGDGQGANNVFIHFKWSAGSQDSLPNRCLRNDIKR